MMASIATASRYLEHERIRAVLLSTMLIAAIALIGAIPARADMPLVLATSKSGWLIWIAEGRGLFEKHNADVTVELTDSGVTAGKGLVEGRYDVATMSEFAFVSRSFDHPDLRVFGTVAAIYNLRLVGREDRGLTSISALPGKKIGLRSGAIGEFFLGRVIELNGLNLADIGIVNVHVPDLPRSLADGEVDGIVSWEPYASDAKALLGDAGLFEEIQSQQPYYFTLAASAGVLSARRDTVEGLLKALLEALEWAGQNQDEAKRILADRLQIEPDSIERFWGDHIMELTVSQDMLYLMEQEALWRLERGLSVGAMPNFLERLDPSPLRRVAPHLVSVIE